MSATTARLLADAVLALHAGFVAFVVLGLVAILVGGALRWRSVRNPSFRALHLAAIGLVVAEAWVGVTCPLTSLEDSLRAAAGEATYSGAFVAHWLGRLLYWQAPPWVFVTAYTIFGAAVAASWWLVRPRPFRAANAINDSQTQPLDLRSEMLSESNPYQAPAVLDAPTEPAPRPPLSVGRLLVGLLLFSIVSLACWFTLILSFFGDSSDYWPGFACAVPAVAAGAIIFLASLGGRTLGHPRPAEVPGRVASGAPAIPQNDTARPARTPDGP